MVTLLEFGEQYALAIPEHRQHDFPGQWCQLKLLVCWGQRLDVHLQYLSALPRTSAPDYGLLDMKGNVHHTWAAFLCGYPLLPYRLPTKTTQRHAVLSWYMYSGVPPSCNSCSVFTVMRIPIIAYHNKIR